MTRGPRQDLCFVHPGPLDQPSGGSIYDRRMLAALRTQDWTVTAHELDGRFPVADAPARAAAAALLDSLADGVRLMIDGLALPAFSQSLPDHAGRLRAMALVHHPTADETGLEPEIRESLRSSEMALLRPMLRIVVPSPAMARRISAYGVSPERIVAVPPGTDPAPRAIGSPGHDSHLLCVASLTARKRHLALLAALAACDDLSWRLTCVGPTDGDPALTARVFAAVERAGLGGRVRFVGTQHGAALAAHYAAADVFVLASAYEGYGMAYAEALARGLPIVASGDGAVADTVPPTAGVVVPVDDHAALTAALRRMIEDSGFRADKADGAYRAGQALPDWPTAGRLFAATIGPV